MTENIGTLIDNMISWAQSRIGNENYAGWCLSFIEDALEIGNDIEIFGGDSAKESSEMYGDALRTDAPEMGAFVFLFNRKLLRATVTDGSFLLNKKI